MSMVFGDLVKVLCLFVVVVGVMVGDLGGSPLFYW